MGGARITGVTTSSGGFVGNLTGNVTGNIDGIVGGNTPAAVTGTTITANTGFTGDLTGDVTGDVTGTATTATNAVQLQTARNIGGVSSTVQGYQPPWCQCHQVIKTPLETCSTTRTQ